MLIGIIAEINSSMCLFSQIKIEFPVCKLCVCVCMCVCNLSCINVLSKVTECAEFKTAWLQNHTAKFYNVYLLHEYLEFPQYAHKFIQLTKI